MIRDNGGQGGADIRYVILKGEFHEKLLIIDTLARDKLTEEQLNL